MSVVLSFNFLSYLFWMTLVQHRSNSLVHTNHGVLDKTLLPVSWGIRKQPPAFHPFPDLGALLSLLLFHVLFLGSFAPSCSLIHAPHRASRINLAELKIINPVVEEGVPLICAVAHLLTPSLAVSSECEDCHAGLFLLQRISFTCVCQGASAESSSQVTYLNKCT